MSNEFIAKKGFITPSNATITGSLTVLGGITGTVTTASFITSSNIFGTVVNATNAGTANTASYITSSNVSGFIPTASFAITSAFALNSTATTLTTSSTYQITASWANNIVSASYALTASFANSANVAIPSRLNVNDITASIGFTGSLTGTSSFAKNSDTSVTSSIFMGLLSSSIPSYQPGVMYYDTQSFALKYFNDNSSDTVVIGRETRVRVFNSSSNYISNSCVVYFSGSNVSGFAVPNVWLAIADGTGNKANVAGIATTDVPIGGFGYVTISGRVDGITSTSPQFNFPIGPLYLSATQSGSYQTTIPTGSFEKVFIGYCIQSSSLGSQLVADINPHSFGTYSSSFSQTSSYSINSVTSSQGSFAWGRLTYDGTTLSQTVYNSSVTRAALGSYKISFNNNASNAFYATIFNGGSGSRLQQGTLTQSFANFTGNTVAGTTMSIFVSSGSVTAPFVAKDFTTASFVIFSY